MLHPDAALQFAHACGVSNNRNIDAVAAQAGACNPSGVARALVRAINACHFENMDTNQVKADPAVRMICHQLAFILGVREIDDAPNVYGELTAIIEARAKATL